MNKLMIIVVDDNLVSRLLPSFILRPFGMYVQVLECDCGVDALRLLEIHQVTHVLLDISMPKMDGVNVAKKIREISKNTNVRLIAYTADAMASDVTYLKSVGFDDVLIKPLKSEALLHVLDIQHNSLTKSQDYM
jgi:CheY-like chemotaxis protein